MCRPSTSPKSNVARRSAKRGETVTSLEYITLSGATSCSPALPTPTSFGPFQAGQSPAPRWRSVFAHWSIAWANHHVRILPINSLGKDLRRRTPPIAGTRNSYERGPAEHNQRPMWHKDGAESTCTLLFVQIELHLYRQGTPASTPLA